MKLKRRSLIAVLAAILLLGAALWGWNWHYRRDVWPKEIQASVLGAQVVGPDELASSEGFSAYGEGAFRWTYRIGTKDLMALAEYCNGQELETCRFTKSKRLNDGVVQSVTYSDGVLTIEEIWE